MPTSRGDGLIRDGIGPISTGRGGTNQAFADNSVVILDNPAAMVNVDNGGLAELGVDTVITSVKYTDPYNSVHSKVRPIPAPVFGVIKKNADGDMALGFGAFSPAGFGSAYGQLYEPSTGTHLTRSLGAMGKLLGAFSVSRDRSIGPGAVVGHRDVVRLARRSADHANGFLGGRARPSWTSRGPALRRSVRWACSIN